jgi:hypothetical protein
LITHNRGPGRGTPAEHGPAQQSDQLQQVTVTGYLVPRIGDGPQPVVTLDQQFFKEQGDQTVADVLQRLPQNSQSFNPSLNAGQSFSPGASTVNRFGVPEEVNAQTPAPGYSKDGKKLVGEKAVAPTREGASGGVRYWLAGEHHVHVRH